MGEHAFSGLLRRSRKARRLSQEQLAFDAEISTRHISYLENGKSQPSRNMVLVLASALQLELRDRNLLLSSAGFAPVYPDSGLESLALAPVRRAVDLLLRQQEPYGAVLIDRCWNILGTNQGAARMLGCFASSIHVDPRIASNLVRGSLHPDGLRPSIVNWKEVAALTLERLERECAMYPNDAGRGALLDEVLKYPGVSEITAQAPVGGGPVAMVHLKKNEHEARLFSMLTTIGTPLDVTAQDLTLESFFPADDATDRWFQEIASQTA